MTVSNCGLKKNGIENLSLLFPKTLWGVALICFSDQISIKSPKFTIMSLVSGTTNSQSLFGFLISRPGF